MRLLFTHATHGCIQLPCSLLALTAVGASEAFICCSEITKACFFHLQLLSNSFESRGVKSCNVYVVSKLLNKPALLLLSLLRALSKLNIYECMNSASVAFVVRRSCAYLCNRNRHCKNSRKADDTNTVSALIVVCAVFIMSNNSTHVLLQQNNLVFFLFCFSCRRICF